MFASIRAIISHTYGWVTSKTKDYCYKNPRFKSKPGTDPIDIYCVHGMADKPQVFFRVMTYVYDKDISTEVRAFHLIAFEGRYQGKGIEHFAQQLLAKIQENQHKRVILLGHSRGGLVASWFAENFVWKKDIIVEAVITLGTPFDGSAWAVKPFTFLSTSVRQMVPKNDFLKTLIKCITASDIKYFFIYALGDYFVSKDSSQVKEYVDIHPGSMIILKDYHGHLSMMLSNELVGVLVDLINNLISPPNSIVK